MISSSIKLLSTEAQNLKTLLKKLLFYNSISIRNKN